MIQLIKNAYLDEPEDMNIIGAITLNPTYYLFFGDNIALTRRTAPK